MVTVYHYPSCSTCKRALAWLRAQGVEFELVDIVKHPPSQKVLAQVLRLADLPLTKLFNTSGEVYRSGNYKERLKTLSAPDALRELSENGKLIKRPLVVSDSLALVGFREADYERAFG